MEPRVWEQGWTLRWPSFASVAVEVSVMSVTWGLEVLWREGEVSL